MKSELKEVSPTQRELHITIDAAVLKDAYGRVSNKFAKQANIPGFRKGYAPVDVVRMRFREDIKSQVLQDVVPGQVSKAILEHDLHPLTEPQLHLEDHENVQRYRLRTVHNDVLVILKMQLRLSQRMQIMLKNRF